jgi:hypothetical protein
MSGERLTIVEKALLHNPVAVASASDVAEAVQERSDALEDAGDPRREVLEDLRLLEKSGAVHSRKVGARARAWWHDDRVVPAPPEDPADHPDQSALDEASAQRRDQEPVDDQEAGVGAAPIDDLPGGVDAAEARAAIDAARELVADQGAATKAEIVREVMPEHPLGYDLEAALEKLDSENRYRGAWWRKVVKPGLEADDDVEKPPRGRSEWKPRD